MPIDTSEVQAAERTRTELYHCASMHGTYEQQRSTIDRLYSLAEAGVVDEVNQHAWAHTLTPSAADDWCERARAKYAQFSAWASANARSLEPAFGSRTVTSITDDEEYDVVEFPVMCLAVYADDELVAVAPSTDPVSETTFTVTDCLSELESFAHTQEVRATSES